MTFKILVALASGVWLLSCVASLLALYWNLRAGSQRLRAAFISSCAGLLIGYLGVARIQLNASQTVNGHLAWSINSRWFFVGALLLAAASATLTVWNWRKGRRRLAAGAVTREASGHSGAGAPANGGPAGNVGSSGVTGGPPSMS